MTTQEAINLFGSQAELARALWACSPSAVSQWGVRPPVLRQFELQLKTYGKLIAELPPTKRKD